MCIIVADAGNRAESCLKNSPVRESPLSLHGEAEKNTGSNGL